MFASDGHLKEMSKENIVILLIAISSLNFSSLSGQDANIVTTNKMASASTLDVDYQQLLEAQKDDKVLIVDVREQDEINETGKLPGSIHIPSRIIYCLFSYKRF